MWVCPKWHKKWRYIIYSSTRSLWHALLLMVKGQEWAKDRALALHCTSRAHRNKPPNTSPKPPSWHLQLRDAFCDQVHCTHKTCDKCVCVCVCLWFCDDLEAPSSLLCCCCAQTFGHIHWRLAQTDEISHGVGRHHRLSSSIAKRHVVYVITFAKLNERQSTGKKKKKK